MNINFFKKFGRLFDTSPRAKSLSGLVGFEKADAIFQNLVVMGDVPGISVTILKNGKTALQKGYGYADLEAKTPIDPKRTQFRIASISKCIAGLAFGKMVEDGLLDWDDSFYKYVPDYPEKVHDFTLRQLASHTAGIRGYRGKEYALNKSYTIKDSIEVFKNDPLLFRPGQGYLYNSFDFVLLSLAMQEASKTPFEDYVKQKILLPLIMHHTEPETLSKSVAERSRKEFGKTSESVAERSREEFGKSSGSVAERSREEFGKTSESVAERSRKEFGKSSESVAERSREEFGKSSESVAERSRKEFGKPSESVAERSGKEFGKTSESVAERSRSYTKRTTGFKEAVPVNNFYKLAGGGYVATSHDIATMGQAILNGQLLKETTYQQLLTSTTVNDTPTYYGLGFQVSQDKKGRPFVGHVGSSVGAYTNFFVYPEQQTAIALLVNCTDPKIQPQLDAAIDAILEAN